MWKCGKGIAKVHHCLASRLGSQSQKAGPVVAGHPQLSNGGPMLGGGIPHVVLPSVPGVPRRQRSHQTVPGDLCDY
jgi:hypothetical protein